MAPLTKEYILQDNGLRSQRAQMSAVGAASSIIAGGALLDARPGQVDVEEQQQDAEADDAGVEAVAVAHQRVVQQVAVDLGLDQHQVDEEHHVVVLDVLVAEAAAVLAHRQPDVVPAARPARRAVLRPERAHRVPALDADGHGG